MIPVFKYLYKQLIPGIKKLISPFGIAEWYRQLQTTADINKSKYSDVTIAKYYYIIIIIIERMLLESSSSPFINKLTRATHLQ